MSSPGQKRGGYGHAWPFDQHTYCVRCLEKNKGKDPCVENKEQDCKFYLALTPEQLAQISTPTYKIKKEKQEARKADNATPTKTSDELVDPAIVSVIGVVGQQETAKSSTSVSAPPEKKLKKSASVTKAKKSTEKSTDPSATDSKIAELDQKWSEWFNHLETLLLAKTLQQPTFSSDIKVNPPRSPPASIPRDSEPFFPPTERTGKDFSAEMYQSASQPESDVNRSLKCTGIVSSASLHQPAGQLSTDWKSAKPSSPKCTGKGFSAHSINRPASLTPTRNLHTLHLQSALARVPLLHCINWPASLVPTDSLQELHAPSVLLLTLLLSSNSLPASLTRTGTDLLMVSTLVNHSRTDLLLLPLRPALLLCTGKDKTVFQALAPVQ